jgi:hypothetical protein
MNEEKRSKELVKITSSWQNSKDVVRRERELEGATTFADEMKSAVVTKRSKSLTSLTPLKSGTRPPKTRRSILRS